MPRPTCPRVNTRLSLRGIRCERRNGADTGSIRTWWCANRNEHGRIARVEATTATNDLQQGAIKRACVPPRTPRLLLRSSGRLRGAEVVVGGLIYSAIRRILRMRTSLSAWFCRGSAGWRRDEWAQSPLFIWCKLVGKKSPQSERLLAAPSGRNVANRAVVSRTICGVWR